MAFAENLAAFFPPEFSEAAVFNGATVYGCLSRDYVEPVSNYVVGFAPTFECPAADVPGVTDGSDIVIEGIAYKVREVRPDATRTVVTLGLEEQ